MKTLVESIGKVGSRARVGNHELLFDCPAYGTLLHPPSVELEIKSDRSMPWPKAAV